MMKVKMYQNTKTLEDIKKIVTMPLYNKIVLIGIESEKDHMSIDLRVGVRNGKQFFEYALYKNYNYSSLEFMSFETEINFNNTTLEEIIEEMKEILKEEIETKDLPQEISIKWSFQDVKQQDKTLTKKECCEILQMLDKYHDANIGISWEIIDSMINVYRTEKEEEKDLED